MKYISKNIILTFVSIAIVVYVLMLLLNFLHIIVSPMFPWMTKLTNRVSTPAVTYGEFPCRLTYEINHKVEVLKDTVICEFDGVEDLGSGGKRRKWRTYLKSGNDRITLMDLSSKNVTNGSGYNVLELFFSYGNGEYYMGDEYGSEPKIDDYVEYLYSNNGVIGSSAFSADEAYEKYGIRLISWECASPIENNFK